MDLFKILGTIAINAKDAIADIDSVDGKAASLAKNMSTGISSFGSSFAKVGGVFKAIGTAVVAASVPIVGFFTTAASKAINFYKVYENTMITFTNKLEGGATAAKKLYSELLDLAKASTYSQETFLRAAQYMVGVGLSADQTTRYLQATKDAVAAFGGTDADIQQLAETFARVAATGKLTGMHILQMSNAGVPALKILAAHFGVTTDEAADMVSNGLIPGAEAIDIITDALEQTDEAAADFQFSVANMAALLKSGSFTGALDSFSSAVRNLGRAMYGIDPTLESGQERMKRIVEVINKINDVIPKLAKMFEWLPPLIDRIASAIKSLVGRFELWLDVADPEQLGQVGKMLAFVVAAGPGMVVLGKAMKGVGGAIDGVGKALPGVAGFFSSLGTLFGGLSSTAWTAVSGFASALGQGLKGAFDEAKAIVSSALEPVKNAVKNVISGIGQALGGAFSGIKDKIGGAFSGIKDKIGNVLSGVKDKVSGVFNKVGESLSSIGKGFADKFGGAFGNVGSKLSEKLFGPLNEAGERTGTGLASKLGGALGKVGGGVMKVTGMLAGAATGILALGIAAAASGIDLEAMADTFTQKLGNIAANIPDMVSQLTNVLPTLISAVTENVPKIVTALTGAFTSLAQQLPIILPQLSQGIVTLIGSLAQTIMQMIPMLLQVGIQLFTTLIRALAEIQAPILAQLPELIVSVVTTLLDNLPFLLQAGIDLLMGLLTGILNAIPQLLEKLPEIITALLNFFTEAIPKLIDAGVQLLTALINDMPGIIAAIVGVIPQIITGLLNFFTEAIPKLIDAGVQLLTALVENLPTIIDTIVEAIPQIIAALVNFFTGPSLPRIIDAGVRLLEALIDALPTIIITIVDALPQIITAIVNALSAAAPKLAEAGRNLLVKIVEKLPELGSKLLSAGQDLVNGIIKGVEGMAGAVWSAFQRLCSGALDAVKNFFGIASPSKVMKRVFGEQVIGGAIMGIGEAAPGLAGAMEEAGEAVLAAADKVKPIIDVAANVTADSLSDINDLQSNLDAAYTVSATSSDNYWRQMASSLVSILAVLTGMDKDFPDRLAALMPAQAGSGSDIYSQFASIRRAGRTMGVMA